LPGVNRRLISGTAGRDALAPRRWISLFSLTLIRLLAHCDWRWAEFMGYDHMALIASHEWITKVKDSIDES